MDKEVEPVSAFIAVILSRSTGWVYSYNSVRVAMDMVNYWGSKIEQMEDGPTRRCHEQLIRLAKGQIKAWRLWLAER